MSLVLSEMHKRYGPVHANNGISLEVESGTLHGLLGENGAGKSTLMKILSGFIEADSGTITLDGKEVLARSPKDAIAAGIGMLHQDPLVFLPLTVLDNFLIASPGPMNVNRRDGARALEEASKRFGFKFNPNAPARTLTIGERQQLEIVRLLWLGARVLILDEPTTGISEIQRVELFSTLKRLADDGMSVIFVSHKLEEVADLCQRVTVMRQGQVVGHAELPTPASDLVEMMFGQVVVQTDRPRVEIGQPNVVLENATIGDRKLAMDDVSVSIASGEVVGLAGLEGSGQRLFLETCAGLQTPSHGTLEIAGTELTGKGYRQFLEAGVHYLPAGRLEEGLVAGLTISEHLFLAGADKPFFIDWEQTKEAALEKIEYFSIKGFPDSPAESLSGGNQQRLLLSMMEPSLRLLLMEHPTRGLDIESADWVWKELLTRRDDGTSIIFASADLDELLRYSDRIMVFFNGAILRTVDAATTSGEALGYLIGGKDAA